MSQDLSYTSALATGIYASFLASIKADPQYIRILLKPKPKPKSKPKPNPEPSKKKMVRTINKSKYSSAKNAQLKPEPKK
ncbi:hypothetical protein DLAC_02578 [Tieghemostelium lacteum]|uniref:Uncharacterized protein n=1 Tax=Tieghemostelium lacteum TaxID=361077 RepID=A0A152A2S5_TIELA|nr:hypothetical protein DLAC_02578 [Tieghemostelium lacteum]|eukprot:KYR00562.1 hypothetical protein DLAC_02578 [Tieghemostelium lacteum]